MSQTRFGSESRIRAHRSRVLYLQRRSHDTYACVILITLKTYLSNI